MKAECIGSTICTAVAGTSTALQPNEVWQYIQMGITIIAGIISSRILRSIFFVSRERSS